MTVFAMRKPQVTIRVANLDFHQGVAVTEASTIGLRPGEWPERVILNEGDGHFKTLDRYEWDGNAMRYALRDSRGAAVLTVAILND